MNYDFSRFHPNCVKTGFINTSDGLHLYCLDCGISANLEAIAGKISSADACKVGAVERAVIGKQSSGVDRGGEVK